MNKSIKKPITAANLFLIIVLFIFGCGYRSYSGRYWIGNASFSFKELSATDEMNERIERAVRLVAENFGFVEDEKLDWMDENVITFGKRKQIKTSYDFHDGSNPGITLLIEKGPRPTVGIKDYSHKNETDFIRALKEGLENELSKVVDMKNVEFVRHWDLMD